MNFSFWESETFFKNIDVLVIGSGITGLNAAIHLAEQAPSLRVMVAEKGALPGAASMRNAGFACFGSASELLSDLKERAEDEVFGLVEKRWKGLLQLRKRIGDVELEYHPSGNFEIFRSADDELFRECSSKILYLNRQLVSITGIKEVFTYADGKISQSGFGHVNHMILNSGEGQLHAGKMMQALLNLARRKGVRVMNGLEISRIEERGKSALIHTKDDWTFKSKKILLATNGFTAKMYPDLPVNPARNQVLLTRPVKDLKVQGCFHLDRGYTYFRNIGDRILIGGGRNLAFEEESTSEPGFTPIIRNYLESLLTEVILPGNSFKIEQQWSGILGIGEEKTPIIKKISPNVAVAVRLGGMGVAIGSLAGEEGANLLLKEL